MKVRIGTVDIDDEMRRAIRWRKGVAGLATRTEVRNYYRSLADLEFEMVLDEYRTDQDARRASAG